MRKPIIRNSVKVRQKEPRRGFRKKKPYTAQLICAFVFAYAKSRLSHDAAQSRLVVQIKTLRPKIILTPYGFFYIVKM